MSTEPRELPRRLNLAAAVATIAGVMIGSGIFRTPAEVAVQAGSATAALAVWTAGGLLTLCFALLLAELGAMFPRAGGLYPFLREAWGDGVAFVFGWTYLLINPAGWAAIAMVFAEYLGRFLPMSEPGRRGVALGLIVLVTAANYRSVMLGAGIQNLLSFFKVVALLSLAVFIFVLGNPAGGALAGGALAGGAPVADTAPSAAGLSGYLLALVAVLWAYEGCATFCSLAGEITNPERNVPRALLFGIGGVMLVYLTVNAAYLYILPLEVIQQSPLVASDAAGRVLGAGASALIAGLVMVSTFSSVAAISMADPRVFFAMGRDGNFFAATGRIHPRFATPHVAILVAGLVACAYVSIRTFEQLAATYVLGMIPFYALAVIGVWKLRRARPHAPRPYRSFGYRWVLALYIGAVAIVLGNALIHKPGIALLNLAIAVAAVPVYFVWKRFYR